MWYIQDVYRMVELGPTCRSFFQPSHRSSLMGKGSQDLSRLSTTISRSWEIHSTDMATVPFPD
jgi:hypothetical protein